MEIQKNSRQIPSDMKYTAKKDYFDILYGYLQHISKFDLKYGFRYVEKEQVVFSKLCDKSNENSIFAGKISRQTLSKKFAALIEQGLIEEDVENKRYILNVLAPELATLLPDDTVRVLCNTLQDRCLSVLSYLIKTYFQHGQQSYCFTIDFLKEYVGLSNKDRGKNNQVIKDILAVLEKMGFIKYHIEKKFMQESNSFKTVYILDEVDNMMSFKEPESEENC